MKEHEALKLALEALENPLAPTKRLKAITAIKEALAQPEPVANYCKECLTYNGHHEGCSHYTTPPQRTWVGLTDDDWNSLAYDTEFFAGAEWAEAKLKEKNALA